MVELLRRPRYEVFPLPGIEEEVAAYVPTDVKLTVTSSPGKGLDATLQLTEELARRGFEVVPHVAARLVSDDAHLREVLSRLEEAGVREVFVVAGDADEPAGKFAGAYDLLSAMADLGSRFDEVGIAGYPESHPFISDETTIRSMFDKAPFASYIVSQLCLDPRVIADWVGAVRQRGVSLSIVIGIPGVVPRTKLLRVAAKIGVGDSMRFIRKHGNLVARLLVRGSYGPGSLVDGLAARLGAPELRIGGFHVYTFNELEATERWRQEAIARLGRTAAA